jgi:hypothetical protein
MTYPRKSIESGLAYAAEKRLTLPHPIRMHEIEHDFQPQNVSISTDSLGTPTIQTELSDIARLLGVDAVLLLLARNAPRSNSRGLRSGEH